MIEKYEWLISCFYYNFHTNGMPSGYFFTWAISSPQIIDWFTR